MKLMTITLVFEKNKGYGNTVKVEYETTVMYTFETDEFIAKNNARPFINEIRQKYAPINERFCTMYRETFEGEEDLKHGWRRTIYG